MFLAVIPFSSSDPWWEILFALLVGHAIADYPLQGDFLALGKNHRLSPELRPPSVKGIRAVWFHCLTAHAMIHATIVWAITGSFLLAMVELVLHWIIDFIKSEGWTNFHTDQLLHVICKCAYVAAIYYGILQI